MDKGRTKAHAFIRRFLRRGLRCSFCGRDADQVDRLVAGASAYICGECITKYVAVLDEHGGVALADPGR